MKLPFRKHHLLCIFQEFSKLNKPMDVFLRNYFRSHKAVGSKDRKFIAENAYLLIRWKGLIDYLAKKPITWQKRIDLLEDFDPQEQQSNTHIPLNIRVSFPKEYFDRLASHYGETKATEICLASNTKAPITIRVNTLKTTPEDFYQNWKNKYNISKCPESPLGIIIHENLNFFETQEFKDGFFEVQDEASQLIANLLDPKPNSQVLDYCAGAGGKSLAIGAKMNNQGQLYLHDIRPFALMEAKKRLKRAGVQNTQLLLPDHIAKQKKLHKKMDWILLDVPCSGSGTLRRNPDMKWKSKGHFLDSLLAVQREIFEKALIFCKKNGHIVYSTCSIFPEENQNQVDYFEKNFPVKLVMPPFSSLPTIGRMDGFFGAVFKYCP